VTALHVPGYELIREIKRGGQGVVFEAVQRSTGRRVAIKVLRDWTLSWGPTVAPTNAADLTPVNTRSAAPRHAQPGPEPAAARRFKREIELAAQLRHPGVVRVYDSGTTADGRTYLVMEYVEGPSLDDWARPTDGPARPHAQVLAMLASVCDAVTAAHQRGVIHRDLKPSNIRVDASGQPRVLDFGLAKLHEPSGGDAPDEDRQEPPTGPGTLGPARAISMTGQFIGSLPWAAPEQARGAHQSVDVRTDVYALGAMLYQLLGGAFPCEVSGDLNVALANITQAPPIPLRRHDPTIPEQVEVICAKALAKDPADRYQTPALLADDLRHHLAGEPITARRESAWRGARRKLRRYQIALGVGLASLGIVGGLAWYASSQRAKLAEALEIARQRTRQQDAFNAFLTQMLGAASPDEQGKDVRVIDVLRRASEQVPVKFADDPLTAAKMYGVLGQTFRALGDVPSARAQNDLAIQAALKTGREMTIADVQLIQAKLLHGSLGKGDEAEPLARAALDVRTRRLGPDHEDTLDALATLASSLQTLGRFEPAEEAFRAVLTGYQKKFGDEHRATVTAFNNLAALLRSRGRYTEALPLFEKSVSGAARVYGPEHPSTLITTSNMASCLTQLNRTDEAVAILRRVVQAQERALGPEHPNLAATLNQLASAMQWANTQQPPDGDPRPMKARAVEVFRRALAIATAKLGPAARNTLVFRSNLAVCLTELGRHDEALAEATAAHEACVKTLGPDHWQTLAMQGNVAQALAGLKRYEEAIATTTSVYDAMARARGPTDNETRQWAGKLATFCKAAGRDEEAARWAQLAEPAP
jgi:serine/threonine-protein kinase